VLVAGLAACSSSTTSRRRQGRLPQRRHDAHAGLEVPPDLSQLRATRASSSQRQRQRRAVPGRHAAAGAAAATRVAPKAIGDMRIEREGNQRWLVVPMPPEQLWPQLQAFWKERGFTLRRPGRRPA
jgi:outer membrane protein assembly factor BamC